MGVLEFLVPMRSEKCETKVRRSLTWIPGIESVEVDRRMNKVTVTGRADPKRVLKRLRKTGKPVELWPETQYDPATAIYAPLDVSTTTPVGYEYDYGYEQKYRPHAVKDDKIATMFNDANPRACSIM